MPLVTHTIGHFFAKTVRWVIAIAPRSAAHWPLRKSKLRMRLLICRRDCQRGSWRPLGDRERYYTTLRRVPVESVAMMTETLVNTSGSVHNHYLDNDLTQIGRDGRPRYQRLQVSVSNREPTSRRTLNFAHLFSMSLLSLSTAWMAVSELAPQPVAIYAAIFFLVNATYMV